MSPPRALFLVLATGLTACGGASDDDGGSFVPVFRSGVHIVYDGPSMNNYDVLSTSFPSVEIQDVHRDGAGWIVVINVRWSSVPVWHIPSDCSDCMGSVSSAGGGNTYPVRVSEDSTQWRPFQPQGEWTGGAVMGAYRAGAGGPYEEGVLVTVIALPGIGGRLYPAWRAMRADFASDTFTADARYDGRPLWEPRAPSGPGLLGGIDASGRDYMVGAWIRDGINDWTFPFFEPSSRWDLRGMPRGMDFRSADGLVYEAFGPGPEDNSVCEWSIRMQGDSVDDHMPVTICVQASTLPAGFTGTDATLTVTHVASRGVTWVATEPGHQGNAHAVWLTWTGSQAALETVGLGPGVPQKDVVRPVHPRYGTWIELRQGELGTRRYVDVLADGTAVELGLPDEGPCINDCPFELRWLEPLGDDEYMAFWKVTDESVATHELIVSQQIRATVRPIVADSPDPGASPIPKYPEARPAGPLERACHAVHACWPRTGWDTCLGYWQQLPADSAAVQRFVGAVGSGCEAMRLAWGAPAVIGGDCNQGRCVGDVLLTDCTLDGLGGQVEDAVDCAVLGTTCSTEGMAAGTGACVDGSVQGPALACNTCTPAGGAVHCWAPGGMAFPIVEDCAAQGLGCGTRFGQIWCVPDETCTDASEPMHCDGDVVRYCDGAGFVGETDCSLYGAPCQTLSSGLGVGCDHEGFERDCLLHVFGATCAGDYLVHCAGDDARWLDCRELGMSGCAGSACTP